MPSPLLRTTGRSGSRLASSVTEPAGLRVRVVHVIPSVARRDGGPSEVIRGLLTPLTAAGLSIRVITTDKGLDQRDDDLRHHANIEIHRVRRPIGWSYSPSAISGIVRAVRAADIVHVHSLHTFTSTVALWAAAALRRRVVVQPHGSLDAYHWNQSRLKKALYSAFIDGYALRRAAALIVSSDYEAATRAPRWSRRMRAVSVPLGVDDRLFQLERAQSTSATRPAVLFLGRVTTKKRIDLVLDAFRLLTERGIDADLIVAGPIDPSLPYDPIGLAESAGLSERTRFIGTVDADRRLRLLLEAAVFVLPSDDESFGVSVAEAMAAACATVTTATVGIAAPAQAAEALIIAEQTPRSIADCLARLLEDPSLSQEMGDRGRRYAQAHFTWDRAASTLVSLYQETGQPEER
ncbi:glycosyltransferase [Curtobacterium sp. MCBD17_013]|uniref:glycosyltransferase n=1 Tax=Curtobacterium sp. MCBD17_013 TaxID=2175668 RepID=UPI0011B370C0|nr:glycosyltransferase [Curtobacterium sp. MCBD17_013]